MSAAAGPFAATLFDGQSALRRPVTVSLDAAGTALRIDPDDGTGEDVAVADLAVLPATGSGEARIGRAGQPGWRLVFAGSLPAALVPVLRPPPRYGALIDRYGLWRAALGFAAVSGALALIVATAPRWLAPLVPRAVEQRIGAALVGDLADGTCHTPAGDAALARLVRTVDLPGQPPVRAQVVKVPMVNAVALPGDRVVLFSGLFGQLHDPEAVAGVVAHELGHARKHHVMQALIREFGFSLLFSGASGAMPARVAQLTGLRYSREAEAEADAFARDRLVAARISPLPTAAFFDVMARQEPGGEWTAMLGSHPASAERAALFKAAARPGQDRTVLTAAEWTALSRICTDDRHARSLLGI